MMFFLKKHWRFTVPAVVVLCVILLGVVALYSTGEPSDPKTVYAMPERNSDNPLAVNTGGIPIQTSSDVNSLTTSNAETTSVDESTTISEALGSDADAFETCCPEENALLASSDGASLTPEQLETNRRAWESYLAWKRADDAFYAKTTAYENEVIARAERTQNALKKLYRLLHPNARAEIRKRTEAALSSPEHQALLSTFFDEAESVSVSPGMEADVVAEFKLLEAEVSASKNQGRELADEFSAIMKEN